MSREIPAYKKFLSGAGFNPKRVKTFADLAAVPPASKATYFRRYALSELSWAGAMKQKGLIFTSTSGSTGEATYFGRDDAVDWQYSVLSEFFLRNGPKRPTLLIDCFGMGVWIGGLITYQAFRYAALRGWPVTIITPGINKKEIFHALEKLAPQFGSVIIAGYPPFVKDIMDEAAAEGINFKRLHVRLLFAAESFTETFRDHAAKLAGIKNVYRDTLNLYGSAELGAMAFETPLAILIRRLATRHPEIYKKLFGTSRLPTLAQYNPDFVSFTEENREILISADSAAPFFKYSIGDNGGVHTLENIENIFGSHGLNLRILARREGVAVTTLPFVYIHERSDFSTKLYGAIIYPQHIREALYQPKISRYVTGKFHMKTTTDAKHNQFLQIDLELRRGITESLAVLKLCQKSIVASLLKHNAEYKNNYQAIPAKVVPRIKFWPHEDHSYFKPGIKQTWISK